MNKPTGTVSHIRLFLFFVPLFFHLIPLQKNRDGLSLCPDRPGDGSFVFILTENTYETCVETNPFPAGCTDSLRFSFRSDRFRTDSSSTCSLRGTSFTGPVAVA
jgi:hypothetical protein